MQCVIINVDGNISIGAAESLRALAGEKLGLFAREDKLSLKLEPGRVEYGTTEVYLRKAESTKVWGAMVMPLDLPVMPLAELFLSQTTGQKLKPVLKLTDAPGINGLAQPGYRWQIVVADDYMQAVTTDEAVMSGQSDAAGKVLQTEAQQYQLAELAEQHANRLWLVTGQRAHRLCFSIISDTVSEAVKDICAQDTMGYHHVFNRVTGKIFPGEMLKQCIQKEQQADGTLLKPLREEK